MSSPRIRKVSTVLAWGALALCVPLLVVTLLPWFDPDTRLSGLVRDLLPAGTPYRLSAAAVFVCFLSSATALGLGLFGLVQASLLFRGYGAGHIFTPASGRHLRLAGASLAILPLTQIASVACISLAVTAGNAPHERVVTVALEGGQALVAICGGLLVVVGWIMEEAARIATENAQFV
jgi:hypothetical protein